MDERNVSALRVFLKFCWMKRTNWYVKISLAIFWKKISFGAIWSFSTIFYCLIGHGRNWPRPLLLLTLKQSGYDFFHDYYWILKQSRHDFSGKHLCYGYGMGIMWCLCVEVKIQQTVIWFSKAFFKNYPRKFECKGPWMLKTDSLIF